MSRPLRVAFVAPQILPWLAPEAGPAAGGAERQQLLLARELASRGVEVSFVAFDSGGAAERPGTAAGFRVHRACSLGAGVPFLRFFHPRLTSLWRALREADADVYYQRCAGMLTGVVGTFCRRHGRGFVFASAHETDCDPAALPIRNPRDRALYFHGLRLAHAVVAQTEEQRALFRDRLSIDAAIVRNAAVARPLPAAPPGGRRHVLFLAALRPWKRPEWFVELARRAPGTPFVMAGGDEPRRAGYARALREAAARVPNLTVLGAVPPGRALDLQAAALAFVSASEREGFPNTTLEAWSSGTPVFAAADPDSCIAASGGGVVAPDLETLSRELLAALGDGTRLAAMGDRGRAHVLAHHDPSLAAGSLLAVLEDAARRGAGARRPAPGRAEGALR